MKEVKVLIDSGKGEILIMSNDDEKIKTAMYQQLVDAGHEFVEDLYERKNWGEFDFEIYKYSPTIEDDVAIRADEVIQLNEKQQIVLEIMQNIQKKWPHFHPSSVIDTLMELESEYYDELTKIEELQVYQVFIKWALEQENLVQ